MHLHLLCTGLAGRLRKSEYKSLRYENVTAKDDGRVEATVFRGKSGVCHTFFIFRCDEERVLEWRAMISEHVPCVVVFSSNGGRRGKEALKEFGTNLRALTGSVAIRRISLSGLV